MFTKAFYTAITTHELEKTLSFYVATLGFRVTHRVKGEEGEMLVLENDEGAKLDIIETQDAPAGFHALRTNVEDLDEAMDEIKAQGWEIVAEPVDVTSGRVLLVRDPNGILLSITQHIRKPH